MSFTILRDEVSQQLKFDDQKRLLSRVAISISTILTIYLAIVLVIMPVMTIGKAIAALAAILIGSLSWVCHNERLYTASAATLVGITIIGGFVASLSNGGADGFVAPIMIAAPVIAAVFIGARATLIATIAVILAYISLIFLEPTGLITEPPYSEATLNIAAIVMLSASTGICATGVGYFAAAVQTQIRSLTRSKTRLMELSEQLDHSAHHDSLTGVANRSGLHRYLDDLLNAPSSEHRDICLIHIDLDKFKTINDTHGHPVGDTVLRQAADIMKAKFGSEGLVARVGGDEFVVVLIGRADKLKGTIGDRCDGLIDELKLPIMAQGVECRIGASIGYVVADPSSCTVDSLMTDTDLALYEAKRAGRGRAQEFAPYMREALLQHRLFSSEIEKALADNRVECVLQPQVCIHTGEVTGMEGLGRVRNTSGALLPPAQILPVMIEMGRLVEFDTKVMQQSLDALATIRQSGLDVPYVSVNASSDSLRSEGFVARICSELEQRRLKKSDIVIEILESTLIEDLNDAAAYAIRDLRREGIRSIMDDFGSEHATISNLLKLEIDGFKIDRSLIANLEDIKTLQVVKGVQSIANNLELSVIVEGVETAQQFSLLRGLGCQTIQGFGICMPLEVDAFIAWMSSYGSSGVQDIQQALAN